MLALRERTEGWVSLPDNDHRDDADHLEDEMPKPFLNEYLPTPEEISAACREIQAGWSEAERRRRRGYRRAHHQLSQLRIVRTAFAG